MKIRMTFKTPDVVEDSIQWAVREFLEDNPKLDRGELEDKAALAIGKWIDDDEYLTVEVDTETGSCVVIPAGD